MRFAQQHHHVTTNHIAIQLIDEQRYTFTMVFFLLLLFLFGTRNENYLVFCKVSRKFLYFFFIIYLSLFDKSAWKNTWQYTTSYIVCRSESLYTEKEKEKEKQAGSKDYTLFSLRDFFFFMSPFSAFANFER